MSREVDPLFYRLAKEFEEEADDWVDEEIGEFIHHSFPRTNIFSDDDDYENRKRSGHMALGYVIMLPREQRDELWAKFQVGKGE